MVDSCYLGLLAPYVVEQSGRPDDGTVGLLRSGNALGQSQHAQDMVEIVDGLGAIVQRSSLGDGDHRS